jgi:hypothetical protein
MGNIYVGDIGKEFLVDTETDLSGVTAKKLIVLKPGGQEVEWIPVVTTGATGDYTVLKYFSVSGDLTIKGTHILISYAEWGTGSKHYGEPATFYVYDKFEPVDGVI